MASQQKQGNRARRAGTDGELVSGVASGSAMSVADLLFAAAVLGALLVFPGQNHSAASAVWLFRSLLAVHAILYLLTRRWRLPAHGTPLLGGVVVPAVDSWRTQVLLVVLLLAALLLRLPSLGEGLWFDEIDTLVSFARTPAAMITATFESRNQHMLYSLLARASFVTFGESAWALRLPAVVLGVASLWALYGFARWFTRKDEALFAVALLAVSYHHIWFSQNARGYTALLLWALAGSTIFVRMLAAMENRAQAAWAYGAVMALGVFTHATAVFMVAAHALIWAVAWWRGRPPPPPPPAAVVLPLFGMVLSATLSLLLYAHVLPQLVRTIAPSRPLVTAADLAAIRSANPPALTQAPTYVSDHATGIDRISRRIRWFVRESVDRLALGLAGSSPMLGLGSIAVLVGLWAYARQSRGLLALLVLPGIVTLTILFVLDQILFPRFFFFTLGFIVLLLVRGVYTVASWLDAVRARVLAAVALMMVVLANLLMVAPAWAPKQEFMAARDYIRQHAGAEDAVVTLSMTSLPYRQYLHEPWLEARSGEALRGITAAHRTTWALYTMSAQLQARHPDIWHELQAHFTVAAVFPANVGNGEIFVAVSRAASP